VSRKDAIKVFFGLLHQHFELAAVLRAAWIAAKVAQLSCRSSAQDRRANVVRKWGWQPITGGELRPASTFSRYS
jgi:hypothetical protein